MEVNSKVEDVVKESIRSEWIDKEADFIFPGDAQSTSSLTWSKIYWTRIRRYRDRVDQLKTSSSRD